jgi:hypothetical protein
MQTSARRAWSRLVLGVAVAVPLACADTGPGPGEFTPWVLERVRPTQHTVFGEDGIEAVDSAGLSAGGDLLVCLRLRGDPDPAPLLLEVPLTRLGTLSRRLSLDPRRDSGFGSEGSVVPKRLRFVFFREVLVSGCPVYARSLPVLRAASEAAGEDGAHLRVVADANVQLSFESPEPLWQGQRRLELVPVLASEQNRVSEPGNAAYWAVLPFAFVVDVAYIGYVLAVIGQ